MFKKICTLLILFSSVIISGQNITLLKNTNPKVKELKHSLNTSRDSLIMECEKTIYKVEIFNEDYEKIIIVEDFKSQIPLLDLPAGEFIVEAQLVDKIVVMKIIRYNDITNSTITSSKKEAGKKENLSTNSIEFLLSTGNNKKLNNKNQKFYWTLNQINNGNSSSKTMKLVDQESLDRMILKNKLEQSRAEGKLNELIAWEIYNTSKFMKQQVSDNSYIFSQVSDFFNTAPYYTTENNSQNP